MAKIIPFRKKKIKELQESKPETSSEALNELREKHIKKNSAEVRQTKAMEYLSHINSLHKHKFSYPTLAWRFTKDTHSIDVLHGHCFTTLGIIQEDMNGFPEIALAKKWACERQEEIIEFLNWRLRKYQEAKVYYGSDLPVIDVYIEIFELTRNRFQELFKSYVRS